jgi:hypothetical protein
LKLIKHISDDPSPYELEIDNEEELEIIKEALVSYHEHLIPKSDRDKTIKVENMCEELKIEGFVFS